MPFAFPYGVANLFRLDFGYKSAANVNYFDAVFYFIGNTTGGYAGELGTLFAENYAPDILAVLSDQVVDVTINVLNLGSDYDVYSSSETVAGGVSGTLMSPWQCITLRQATGNRKAPYGWKRFGYITENLATAEGVIEPGYVSAATTLATTLVTQLEGAVVTYAPCLISPANLTHDEDLVVEFATGIYQKLGHDVGRKSY